MRGEGWDEDEVDRTLPNDLVGEAGVPLLLVNLIRLPPYAKTMILMGPEHMTLPHEEDLDAVRATAARAAELGVRTTHLVKALLEVASERDAGLIVFGPHIGRVGRMRFGWAARPTSARGRLPGVDRPPTASEGRARTPASRARRRGAAVR
ncbi:MAG: hypothetical protein ABW135_10465 [Thermoleophilaceae bacterium]